MLIISTKIHYVCRDSRMFIVKGMFNSVNINETQVIIITDK